MAGFVNPSQSQPPPGPGGSPPQYASLPTTSVELSVSCKKLADRDVLSKSDPLCILFEKVNGRWHELGRTEQLANSLNPEWKTKFVVDYRFEERQEMKFEVYDWDTKSSEVQNQDFLAKMECTMANIVAAPGKQFVSIIKDGPSKNGEFRVVAEELTSNKDVVRVQFAAKELDKKDLFGKSDPFLVISKVTSQGQHTVVHRSEVIKNNLNPTWASFSMSVRDLCNGDYSRQLKFDVFDWDSDGSHDLIGSFLTNLTGLNTAMADKLTFDCINQKKLSKKKYKNSGQVYIKSFNIETIPSFVDYIQGGTAMNFSIAVDFTASNKDPRNPQSLHYRQPGSGENQYTTAIRSVGDIIQDYDTDKQFPALGFGGRIPPHGQVSHEFFLNLRPDTPYCSGVDGILQAYFTSLQQVTLYGPTNFAPVIKHVAQFANAYQDGSQYFVLLILTDGVITDMDDTKSAIVSASQLPMSIIIVGVGNEDFSSMEALDSDQGLLRARGHTAARDIVQFVELRKFVSSSGGWNKELLAKHVLAEIPKQLVGWMTKRGVKPKRA